MSQKRKEARKNNERPFSGLYILFISMIIVVFVILFCGRLCFLSFLVIFVYSFVHFSIPVSCILFRSTVNFVFISVFEFVLLIEEECGYACCLILYSF